MVTSEWILGGVNAEKALSVREHVFVDELGLLKREVFDAHDELCAHLIIKLDNETVASARLYPDEGGLCFGFIGVLKPHRGQHLGDLCTRLILYKAQQMGVQTLSTTVKRAFVPYYEAFGFLEQAETSDGLVTVCIQPKDIIWHSACEKA